MAEAPTPDPVSPAAPLAGEGGGAASGPVDEAGAGGAAESGVARPDWLADVDGEDPAAGVFAAGGFASGASGGPGAPPAVAVLPQLPVVDLIGLRFSLQHLRLVGYGLLAVWLSEIVNLLSSPGLGEIGSRLHYISQFLDLSPILLVAIGLIAFQGGLRRSALESAVLPLLLTLLPLLSAFHFFLAPVTVANAITLTQKQQQIGRDQIERIDQQTDRATAILRESDSIEALLSGLQRIPGLQVRVPPNASVAEARLEVRRSLQRERDRLRDRIEQNISTGREAFLRRALTNAVLALLVGFLLWSLHQGAMREMELAIPFLDWVLVQGQAGQQLEVLEALLNFQRTCVSLGWFAKLERTVRMVHKVVRRPSAREIAEQEERERLASQQPPFNPFKTPLVTPPEIAPQAGAGSLVSSFFGGGRGLPEGPSWAPAAGSAAAAAAAAAAGQPQKAPSSRPDSGSVPLGAPGEGPAPPSPSQPDRWGAASEALGADPIPDPIGEWMARREEAQQRRDERRRRRDLERYHAIREQIEEEGLDPFAQLGIQEDQDQWLAAAGGPPPPFDADAAEPGRGEWDQDESALDAGALESGALDAGALDSGAQNSGGLDAGRWDSGVAASPGSPPLASPLPGMPPLNARQLRRLERDHQRARMALRRMAHSQELLGFKSPEELERELLEDLALQERLAEDAPLPARRGLGGLWRWFVTHL